MSVPHRSISVFGAAGLLLGFFGAMAWDRGRQVDPRALAGSALAVIRSEVDLAVSPGPLNRFHAAAPGAARCTACHELTHRIPDERCLACHEEIASLARPASASAGTVHAGFQGACRDCHADHRPEIVQLDRAGFNHARARFPLEGAHRGLDCERCHEQPARDLPGVARLRWQGLPHARCEDCHQDPHAGSLAPAACTGCHAVAGWKGEALRFDHQRQAKFALQGAHARVECAKCHQKTAAGAPARTLGAAVLRGLPHQRCEDCHQDPHEGSLAPADCTACHTVEGWKRPSLRFDHARDARFPLEGAHARVECAKCHQKTAAGAPASALGGAQLRGLGTACAACHQDPHKGSLAPKDCTSCHDPRAWKGQALRFDHARDARFALDPTHAGLACAACHQGQTFRPLETSCQGCHATEAAALRGRLPGGATGPPDAHAELVSCARCHAPGDGPAPAPALMAQRCAECHTPHHARLFLERERRLDELEAACRAAAARLPEAERPALLLRLGALRAQGAHDFQAVAAALTALHDQLEPSQER